MGNAKRLAELIGVHAKRCQDVLGQDLAGMDGPPLTVRRHAALPSVRITSMVIRDLDVLRPGFVIRPFEADPVLVVGADRVLTGSVA